jgi:regulator of sigma E protease
VLAGPLANLLLAVFIYWILNMVGVMESRALLAAPGAQTAAEAAGIVRGDQVLAVDGEPVRSANELRWLLLDRAVDRRPVALTVVRSGAQRELRLDLSRLESADMDEALLTRIGLNFASGDPVVRGFADDSVARAAGLQLEDRIVRVDDADVTSSADVAKLVREAAGRQLRFEVERAGGVERLAITPATASVDGKTIGRIGVDFRDLVLVRFGPLESVGLAVEKTWDTAIFSLKMLGKMITGDVSWKHLSGPVTIADYAGQTARIGLVPFLSFLALVSISLGVLNLLPIPMLDGGHLVYYAVELLKGSPPSDGVVQWGQRAGIAVLLMLTALALFNDLSRLLA